MKQFTELQVRQARQHATPAIIQALIENNAEVIHHPVLVPQTGCATWNHYFFCPVHSVRLRWDRHSPHQHICPQDGAIFTGEPYDGAWWRWLNGLNARASYELGILWLLTEDVRYLNKVREILLGYARYYPDYEEHGGIPYNGPGKANAQTLCEANCHTDFARGFDIIRSALSTAEQAYIAERLLRTGADFLIAHRCNQIHNHEVKINAAIAIIGAVLEDDGYLEFAVKGQYGLAYQLEHALLPDGLWFEGSFHYHFYALQGFFAFEKLACGSDYSLLDKPYYRRMLNIPLQMMMPDMTLPKINDCVNGQEKLNHADVYEFAWWIYGDERYGQLLNLIYEKQQRDSVDALFYRQPLPDNVLEPPQGTQHDPRSGITIIRNKPGRAICVKHTPYGGEHDHYDSLALSVFHDGHAVFPDLGTTGYGAPLHYGYYKNTYSHNTLCVQGKNQPPAIPRVLSFFRDDALTRLIVEVDWRAASVLPDSKTRVEWDEAAYQDIVFRRSISVVNDLLMDMRVVDNPHGQTVDTSYLIDAQPAIQRTYDKRLHPGIVVGDAEAVHGVIKHTWYGTGRFCTWSWSPGETQLFQGKGPDNPSTSDVEYLIMRSEDKRVVHVTVTDFSGLNDIDVKNEEGGIRVTVNHAETYFLSFI
ncbi:heparinase II/III domain-containing protein [unidentified bacterial endosymbiont]|uniref:heparinase II/III domain-containing protein n=1 Tax=unidentified bacterial endosymbiont TaxID=2355 RepID=UPI00209DBD5F|nr:heparinase II/III family protein [unidentified bacterial endosymbiont]